MATTRNNINITKSTVVDNNLELIFTTSSTSSPAVAGTSVKPLRVAIDNQSTFICKNENSDSAVKSDIISSEISPTPSSSTATSHSFTVNKTIDLSATIVTPESDLLFVFIYSQDGATTISGTPEYLEAIVSVYDEEKLQNIVLNAIKQDFIGCDKECNETITSAYIVNLYNGFRYAIATEDYKAAITFWNKLNNYTSSAASGCNCH